MPDPCFAQFDFDLARAVLDQLVEAFGRLSTGQLCPNVIATMPPGQGVYQLFLSGSLVYIGKADDGLPKRLDRHYRVLSARQNICIADVRFKALYIHRNWTTWTTEDALIRHSGADSPWNTSGLGSNDPGHNREDTGEEDTFNSRYPINPEIRCDWVTPGTFSAWDVLNELKEGLPYIFRFHRVTQRFDQPSDQAAEQELRHTQVTVPAGLPARELLKEVARQLPPGWQATTFPGRMILYKENVRYRHGNRIWPEHNPGS